MICRACKSDVVPVARGTHRLLCGDSTDAAAVQRLFGGERAGLMNTDPPFGVAYANDDRPNPGVAKPRVANDDLADEKLQAFLEQVFWAGSKVTSPPTTDAATVSATRRPSGKSHR